MFSDNRLVYFNSPKFDPPYTVEYEYEKVYYGILSYPVWLPVPGYNISVEKAVFNIINLLNEKYRNYEKSFTRKIDKAKNRKKYQVNNIPAIEKEPMNPYFSDILPVVYTAPVYFSFDGYDGFASSWSDFGLFN